jgi:TonB-dependent starch-binding outer membrane protein SusC
MKQKLLKGIGRAIPMLIFSLLLCTAAFAQKTVSGKVLGKNGLPVVGATIQVKGSNVVAISAADGSYSIVAPSDQSILTISSVGYESFDIAASAAGTINLSDKDNTLNEVVVTGYSSQARKDITGAVAVVSVSKLKQYPAADVSSQLQGRAAGVNVTLNGVPGTESKVRIRGLTSFNNNNPLYVIDGVQSSTIGNINPNDVESMQVLKDAASAAIYGVRASNGVIIVTTKQGKKKGVSVAYDGFYGVSDPGKGPDLLNAQEQADLLFLSRRHSGLTNSGSVFGNGANPVLPDYLHYTGKANNGVPIFSGDPGVDPAKYDLNQAKLGTPGYTPYIIVPTAKAGTDWYEAATRSAPIQSHNITLNGSNDASRVMFSMNYFDQKAITNNQFFKRYTARLNSEFNVLKGFRIGENIQLLSSEANTAAGENNTEGSVISNTYRITSLVPVYTIVPGDFAGTLGGTGFGTLGNGKNPVAQLERTKDNRGNNLNLFGNLYAELDFLKNFTARSSFGGGINTTNYYNYPWIEYEHTENTANTTYNEGFIRNNYWIWTNQISYKNTFGKHAVSGVIGMEAQEGGGRQVIGSAQTFFRYDYRPYINLNNGAVQNLGGSVVYTPVSTLSYFAQANYAFDGKYLVSALVRRDGSSKFFDENKWGTFPAFSVGWRISQESFMSDVSWISDLKLRASWGKLGNEAAVPASNSFTTFTSNRQSSWYDITGTNNSPTEGFFLASVGNQGGRWETTATTNIGFDALLFKGQTEIVFDWYKKKTDGLLYNPASQAIAGAVAANNPPFSNVGSMENSGIDLMINQKARIGRDLILSGQFTLTTYKNLITAISNDGLPFFDFNSPTNEANRIGQPATRNFVGQPLNTYFGYKVVGLFQDSAEILKSPTQDNAKPGRFKFADTNGDGAITADDRTILGDPNPKVSYGINLSAEYKGFDFTMFFFGIAGREAFNWTRWYTDFSGGFPGGRSKRALYESWLPDGSRPDAKTPIAEASFNSANTVSSYYVEDADYFRLRNLQIGYTLPFAISSKANLSKVRIYLQGTNLFTITKYTGLDPEIISNDDRSAGIDIGAYPTVRQYLIGLNVTF